MDKEACENKNEITEQHNQSQKEVPAKENDEESKRSDDKSQSGEVLNKLTGLGSW